MWLWSSKSSTMELNQLHCHFISNSISIWVQRMKAGWENNARTIDRDLWDIKGNFIWKDVLEFQLKKRNSREKIFFFFQTLLLIRAVTWWEGQLSVVSTEEVWIWKAEAGGTGWTGEMGLSAGDRLAVHWLWQAGITRDEVHCRAWWAAGAPADRCPRT